MTEALLCLGVPQMRFWIAVPLRIACTALAAISLPEASNARACPLLNCEYLGTGSPCAWLGPFLYKVVKCSFQKQATLWPVFMVCSQVSNVLLRVLWLHVWRKASAPTAHIQHALLAFLVEVAALKARNRDSDLCFG